MEEHQSDFLDGLDDSLVKALAEVWDMLQISDKPLERRNRNKWLTEFLHSEGLHEKEHLYFKSRC